MEARLTQRIAKLLFWAAMIYALLASGVLLPTGPRSPYLADAFLSALTVFGATYAVSIAIFLVQSERTGLGNWLAGTLIWAVSLGAAAFANVDWRWYSPDALLRVWDAWIASDPTVLAVLTGMWGLALPYG